LAKGLFKKKDDINSTKDIDELLSDVVGSEENVSEDELVEETSTETSVEAPVEASESPKNS
jgi:hypothetical protein